VSDQQLPTKDPDSLQLAAIIVRRRELRGFVGDDGIAAAANAAGVSVGQWVGVERGFVNLSVADHARMASVLDPDNPDALAARLQRLGGYHV